MSFRLSCIPSILLVAFSVELSGQILSEDEMVDQKIEIQHFIAKQNEEFKNPEKSPLIPDSIKAFQALNYFPINTDFIFKGKFEKIPNGRTFEMPTTTKRLPVYKDFALVKFTHQGNEVVLHLYQNVELSKKEGYADYLFLPFNDFTNGIESYGGGRYIDFSIPEGDEIIIDFNQSYNPYCAYNDKYSCPIPPEENKLHFRVEAGVKKYH